jgi:hypothetical protein
MDSEEPSERHIHEEAGEHESSSPERRTFIKGAGFVGIGALLASLGEAAQHPSPNAPLVQSPVQATEIENIHNDLPDGNETYMIFSVVGSNNVAAVNKVYSRRIDTASSYVVFTTCTVSWHAAGSPLSESTPWVSTHSTIVTGQKGDVNGNVRNDRIKMTTIYGDGEMRQSDEMSVPVILHVPDDLANMSFQERLNYFSTKRKSSRQK